MDDVERTDNGYLMSGSGIVYNFSLRTVAKVLAISSIYLILTQVVVFFAGRLCKAFRDCASPFEDNVVSKMQKLAFFLIPWALISSVTDVASQSLFDGGNVNITINFGMVIIILITFALAYIFKYGAILQKELDETL